MKIRASKLGYTERSGGEFRDLRQIEVTARRRFARVSLNGQYQQSLRRVRETRQWNPGWAIGFERCYLNVVRFRRHCWHIGVTVGKRGLTVSGGRTLS